MILNARQGAIKPSPESLFYRLKWNHGTRHAVLTESEWITGSQLLVHLQKVFLHNLRRR